MELETLQRRAGRVKINVIVTKDNYTDTFSKVVIKGQLIQDKITLLNEKKQLTKQKRQTYKRLEEIKDLLIEVDKKLKNE
jgi:hypothetical protein